MTVDLFEDKAPGLLAASGVCYALAMIAVALRLVSRKLAHIDLWWDDYLAVFSAAAITSNFTILYYTIQNGLGKHQAIVKPDTKIVGYLKYTYGNEILYAIVITNVKSSILLLYLRIFSIQKTFVRAVYVFLGLVISWGIAMIFVTIFQCIPVAAAWDKSILNPRCIDLRTWILGNNIPNILLDFGILTLPLYPVWRLKLSTWGKVRVSCIFLLGFIATIISILRSSAYSNLDLVDATFGYVDIAIYSIVEGDVGVICSCLPAMAPLVRFVFGHCGTVAESSTGKQAQTLEQRQAITTTGRFERLVDNRGDTVSGMASETDGRWAASSSERDLMESKSRESGFERV